MNEPGESTTSKTTVNLESMNIAVIIWIGTIFLGFVPGLVFYFLEKDDEYITRHAKEALNWSITAGLIYIIAFALKIILSGFILQLVLLLVFAIGYCHLIFCIHSAINSSNGKQFKLPFSIRLIK